MQITFIHPALKIDWNAILHVIFMSTKQPGNSSLVWRWKAFFDVEKPFLFFDLAGLGRQIKK